MSGTLATHGDFRMLYVNVHRRKYFDLYQQMALSAARQSVAVKRQVGCVIVTPSGMIAPGWNGMPAGFPNQCEHPQDSSW